MNRTFKVAAAVSVTGVLALAGCSGDSSADSGDTLNVVGYSVLEQANEGVINAFNDTDAGDGVTIKGSYGASGDQSRAVVAGQDADEVHLSLEPDVTRLVDEGIVADDWKDNDTQGICTQSVVVFVVPKGNPKGIEDWSDLVQPGVGIVTPNPASSGSAKWNLLAAYGSVRFFPDEAPWLLGGLSAVVVGVLVEGFRGAAAGRSATEEEEDGAPRG